jgi:hypothetical protein
MEVASNRLERYEHRKAVRYGRQQALRRTPVLLCRLPGESIVADCCVYHLQGTGRVAAMRHFEIRGTYVLAARLLDGHMLWAVMAITRMASTRSAPALGSAPPSPMQQNELGAQG